MATEKTLEILKKMKADPKAKELFEGMEKPKSPDEAISAYARVAGNLGYDITADDIKEAVKQEETRRKANTDKVVADMQELKDDDLEGVAGGFYRVIGYDVNGKTIRAYNQCTWDFEELCVQYDACKGYLNYYYDCSAQVLADGADYDCYVYESWGEPNN